MVLALCCLVLVLGLVESGEIQSKLDKIYSYQIDATNWTYIVDKRFLSYSLDSYEVYRRFKKPSITNKELIKIISHLGGGYLRFGGNLADQVVFTLRARSLSDDNVPLDIDECDHFNPECPVMTRKAAKDIEHVPLYVDEWVNLNNFCQATGLKLSFDLNVMYRTNDANDTWDPSNAALLMDFSSTMGYEIDWELGNEPNNYRGLFGVVVTPEKLAADYRTLRQLLYQYPLYRDSNLMGPSSTNPKLRGKPDIPTEFIRRFLVSGGDVDAIAWHFYYSGPNMTVNDYLNPALLDRVKRAIDEIKEGIKDARIPSSKPVWLSEAGSSYGGGVRNVSDRFAGSFLYLNTLGTAASSGISLVVRQSLYRATYKLLDPDTMTPLSDFWVSVLYKRLVGRKVLDISEVTGEESGTDDDVVPLRVFAHCSTSSPYPVIYGMNLNNKTLGLSLKSDKTGDFFSLTGKPDLLSRQVELNGKLLELQKDYSLPKITPITVDLKKPVPVAPYSIFYLVSHDKLAICQ